MLRSGKVDSLADSCRMPTARVVERRHGENGENGRGGQRGLRGHGRQGGRWPFAWMGASSFSSKLASARTEMKNPNGTNHAIHSMKQSTEVSW